MLPWTMRWKRWHKTQRSKNTLSSLRANVPGNIWPPLLARVLPGSTGPVARYLGPHLDIMGSIRPELERRRAAAFRTWTRFRPVWFRAGVPLRVRRLFFQALVVFILYTGLEALRLRSPDYEYLDRFVLGRGRKMMRGKATIRTKLEDAQKKTKAHSRQKEGVGLPWPGTICHGTSRSSPSMVPEPYEGPDGSSERLVFLFGYHF